MDALQALEVIIGFAAAALSAIEGRWPKRGGRSWLGFAVSILAVLLLVLALQRSAMAAPVILAEFVLSVALVSRVKRPPSS